MQLLTFRCFWLTLLSLISVCGKAQSDADQKKQSLKSLVDSKKFAFIATSATSKNGKTVQLSPGYGLKIDVDDVQADLPYYGRAYTTTYPPGNNGGIQFNTHDFSYQADTTKKGGWDITIKPKGIPVSAIYLSVSSSGYCSVRINSSDRDPISYYGNVTENPGH